MDLYKNKNKTNFFVINFYATFVSDEIIFTEVKRSSRALVNSKRERERERETGIERDRE